jgi:hypothetical protein
MNACAQAALRVAHDAAGSRLVSVFAFVTAFSATVSAACRYCCVISVPETSA